MPEYLQYILLFLAGITAGFINVNAGGGSSLTLPVLIFMGLEGAVANGTNRIGILIQTLFSVSSFRKEKVHNFKKSLRFAIFTLPGAIAGAMISVRLTDTLFRQILGLIMIGIVLTMIFSHKKKTPDMLSESGRKNWWIYPAMVGIGFYGGFIQVGVGFLLMAAFYHLLRIHLVRVNMHKVFVVFIYTLPALLIFVITGNIHWGLGITLAAGNAIGGWWGAKFAVKGGEKVIKIIMGIAIVVMAARLLHFF